MFVYLLGWVVGWIVICLVGWLLWLACLFFCVWLGGRNFVCEDCRCVCLFRLVCLVVSCVSLFVLLACVLACSFVCLSK